MKRATSASGGSAQNESEALLDGPTRSSWRSSTELEDQGLKHPGHPGTARVVACSQYDSLNYESSDSYVARREIIKQDHLHSIVHSIQKTGLCACIGITTAIVAFLVNIAVENTTGVKFQITLAAMQMSHTTSFLLYALFNCALVGVSTMLVVYVAPAAAGSGIPDVKAYLNGVDVPGVLLPSTLAVKVIGATGAVAGGMALGKEGPFVHIGSALASILSQGNREVDGQGEPSGGGAHPPQLLSAFHNDRDRRDMVTCGAAAGVAAAFRSPVGGMLFALEEAASWWTDEQLWLAFFTTAVVTVTVRVLLKLCGSSGCGFFGSEDVVIYHIKEGQQAYEVYEMVPTVILGIMGGLLGSAFNGLNAMLSVWRRDHLYKSPAIKVVEAVAMALLTTIVSFATPALFDCLPCPPDVENCPRADGAYSGNFVSFMCQDASSYNPLATLFFSSPDDAIRNLFSAKTDRMYSVSALAAHSSLFFVLAILTYGIALPAGLFVPGILFGASYGRLVGMFVADMHPQHSIDEATYALLGSASFLAGSMRMTVSLCVILLELTNNLTLLPLVMLVLLVAKAVGDGTGIKGIYGVHTHIKGLPLLEECPEPWMRHVTAVEACNSPAVTLRRVEPVRHLVQVLADTAHNGYPVLHSDAEGHTTVMGMVLRQQLLMLLASKKAFQHTPAVMPCAERIAAMYRLEQFDKPVSTTGRQVEAVAAGLTEESLKAFIDLGPYVSSCHVVQENTTLDRVHDLFRGLGLRHLLVVPKETRPTGVITRKDLLPSTLEANNLLSNPSADDSGTMRRVGPVHEIGLLDRDEQGLLIPPSDSL